MFKYFKLSIILLILASCNNEVQDDFSVNNYVNPFIGTGSHGHTFPGAQAPFGMTQLSPDNGKSGWDWCSGYHYSDSIIVGFSHTHLSGTGIGDLQDISIMPTSASFDLCEKFDSREKLPYSDFFSHKDEIAKPGYYKVRLEKSQIIAELTATKRCAYHKYTFPNKSEQKIHLDLNYAQNWDATVASQLEIINDSLIIGYRFSSGWAKDQKVFFAIKTSKPVIKFSSCSDSVEKENTLSGKNLKALFEFDNSSDELELKVAISSVSTEGALKNLNSEEMNFSQAKNLSQNNWEKQLNKITVKSSNDTLKEIFYTASYHSFLAPTLYSDIDNSYRGADGQIHRADNFDYYSSLSLWDVFRSQHPLLTITNPKVANDIAKTMLNHFDETGTLPVWVLWANETNTMTAYHSLPMIAELINKGIANFDEERAFKAMKATMMQDQRGLKQMREFGYVPYNLVNESVTISLELAYNDYALSQVAKKLNHIEDYKYFLERSMAYKKLFDPQTEFMRGKDDQGNWREEFDPKFSSHRVGTDYTEGNAWQHSWFVLHDVPGLIKLFGSNEKFNSKLDQLFSESSEINGEFVSPDISGLIGQYAHGNEPSHHIAYMYNFSGQPWKTQYMVNKILKEQYSNQNDGISGNEDMGQMSAWYIMSSMGLYPFNPVDGNYLITSPLFEKTTINLENGKTFEVIAENISEKNIYIQSAEFNGENFDRLYISHSEILKGGTLKYVMGPKPNYKWGTKENSLPQSVL